MVWLKHDIESRSTYLPELLKVVRLNLLTIEYLDQNLQEEDLIKSNLKCTYTKMYITDIFIIFRVLSLVFIVIRKRRHYHSYVTIIFLCLFRLLKQKDRSTWLIIGR